MKTIYLCGFMGCGKSTVGKITASITKSEFVDLDNYIVNKEGMSIPDIFARKGEAHFRKSECDAISELDGGYVIATGGGALINEESAKTALERGIVIFIDTPFKTCYTRIKNDKNRPLVVNNTKEQLEHIFTERRTKYKQHSTFTVNGNTNATQIAKEIQKLCCYTTQK